MSSKQPQRWLAFCLISVAIIGALIGLSLVVRPVADKSVEGPVLAWAAGVLGRSPVVSRHFSPSDQVIKELLVLNGGGYIGRLEIKGYSGILVLWAIFGQDGGVQSLRFPRQSSWEKITKPNELDSVTKASVDLSNLKKALESAQTSLRSGRQ